MPNLMPSDIKSDVLAVLQRSTEGDEPQQVHFFLTSYQILDRLPPQVRDRLIDERGLPGKDSGHSHSSAKIVADAAESLRREGQVESAYLDNSGAHFTVSDTQINSGYPVCAIFRYRPQGRQ